MKTLLSVMIAMFAMLFVNAKESVPEKEIRSSAAYHSIFVKGTLEITLINESQPGLKLEGTHEQLQNVSTYLLNDTLFIVQTNNHDRKDNHAKIEVNVDHLVSLYVDGKSSIKGASSIDADILDIKVDNGANVSLDVRALKVISNVIGCGVINVTGTTGKSIGSIEGCGSLQLFGLNQTDISEEKIL